jgi:hypothetical protein
MEQPIHEEVVEALRLSLQFVASAETAIAQLRALQTPTGTAPSAASTVPPRPR